MPNTYDNDARVVASYCRRVLNLRDLPDDELYSCLSLCVIDAVFSIGVRYEAVINVVRRYCDFAGLGKMRSDRNKLPDRVEQEPLSTLISRIESEGAESFARNRFQNTNRTAPTNGILKAEAVLRFSKELNQHDINFLQDLENIDIKRIERLEDSIRNIPGQRSGISFRYFLMLTGNDGLIKPDRMILKFLKTALHRDKVDVSECQPILAACVRILRDENPYLTARLLDGLIWNYQRTKSRPVQAACTRDPAPAGLRPTY